MAEEEDPAMDSWEEQADSGLLDKRFEEMSIDLKGLEQEKQMTTPGIVMTEDCGRTQYQPQVRILRRENNSTADQKQKHGNSSPSSQSASKHSKSLQQREAEYAEARLRIFGTLEPPADEEESVVKDSKGKDTKNSSPQIVKPDPSVPHMEILRQPKGPDGSAGFAKPDIT